MANLPGTNISAPIVPNTTEDIYTTHYAKYGTGGWRSVANAAERDAILPARLEVGMMVVTLNDKKKWELLSISNPLTSADWQELATGTGTPLVHTHVIADVTGLQGALDSKEASIAKNTAFNKNFGTGAGTVSEGNHTHVPVQVGLGNVTNDAQVKRSEMGVANGVATLDSTGRIPISQQTLPITIILNAVSGTISIDLSAGDIWILNLNGNINSFNVTNGTAGKVYQIYFIQDAIGNRTLGTLDTKLKREEDRNILLSTTANAIDMLQLIWRNSSSVIVIPIYDFQ